MLLDQPVLLALCKCIQRETLAEWLVYRGHNKEDKRWNYICCFCYITKSFFFSLAKKRKWPSTPPFSPPCFFLFLISIWAKRFHDGHSGTHPSPKHRPCYWDFFLSFFGKRPTTRRSPSVLFFYLSNCAKKRAFAHLEKMKWNFISRFFSFLFQFHSTRPTWLLVSSYT